MRQISANTMTHWGPTKIQWTMSSLVQIVICRLCSTKSMPNHCWQVVSRALKKCLCVFVSIIHELVHAITHQPFKLGSPNWDQRYKRPWLRSLLFCGTIDRDLQSQIELSSQNSPHFELVCMTSHHRLKSRFPNLDQKCILALLRSLLILELIDLHLQFNF